MRLFKFSLCFADKFIDSNQLQILTQKIKRTRSKHLSIQATFEQEFLDEQDQVDNELEKQNYKKDLLNSLVSNDKGRIKFQNAGNSVAVTNNPSSKSRACHIM